MSIALWMIALGGIPYKVADAMVSGWWVAVQAKRRYSAGGMFGHMRSAMATRGDKV